MKNFADMMKQAQAMQDRLKELQDRIGDMEATGVAGAGMVEVTLNGKGYAKRLKIEPDLMKPDEREVLEDLICAAINDAKSKLDQQSAEQMKGLTERPPLPPGFPDRAAAEEVIRVVESCPSGALTYQRAAGGETPAKVNTCRLWEDGPIEFRGALDINGETATRRLLCRCGQSAKKPYCDNSHRAAGFKATGEVASADDPGTLDQRDGTLKILPTKDGSLAVSGNLEIIAASGRKIAVHERAFLCRCGASKNKPYCDGSHKAAGFEAD